MKKFLISAILLSTILFLANAQPALAADADNASATTLPQFEDIDINGFDYQAVKYVVENDLMNGVSPTLFDTDSTLTRAMFTTILWRMTGEPVVNYALSFEDVNEDMWYTEAIRWATSIGLVEGYSSEFFNTNAAINREQIATILYRYEQNIMGGGFEEQWSFTIPFSDASSIPEWALEAFSYMLSKNVIAGLDDGSLGPQNTVSRLDVATIMMLYLEAK